MSDFGEQYQIGGVDDEPDTDDTADEESTEAESDPEVEPESSPTENSSTSPAENQTTVDTQEIPHRVKYDSPKTDREPVTFSLDPEDEARIDELESLAKQEFDEKVWKTDVELAALRVGTRSPEREFLEAMREIGYGYFD